MTEVVHAVLTDSKDRQNAEAHIPGLSTMSLQMPKTSSHASVSQIPHFKSELPQNKPAVYANTKSEMHADVQGTLNKRREFRSNQNHIRPRKARTCIFLAGTFIELQVGVTRRRQGDSWSTD